MVAVTTVVSSGAARERAPALARAFGGGALMIADVVIDDHLAYVQHSERHLVHATLAERSLSAKASAPAERRGALSFTPADRQRHGAVGRGRIVGLEISLDAAFMEAACEQPLRLDWRMAFNARDDKAFVLAENLGAACRREHETLSRDVLALALARRLGKIYGGADGRRDDGWLHPKALVRVLERMHADPIGVSLAELAREAGLGVSAFMRAFRGSLGRTPISLAIDLRLERAALALRDTDQSLSEIAAMAGFASASHLVRTFRARRGLTPAHWRRARDGFAPAWPLDVTKSAQARTSFD